MLLTIAALLIITIALAVLVLAPNLMTHRLLFDHTPDRPSPFGYQMAWLAVRSVDTLEVQKVLGITNCEPSNWNTGIGTIYHEELGAGRVFVSPPIEGWTFVVGLSLPQPLGPAFADKCTPLMLDLGATFPEVQYFLCDSDIEIFAWARVQDGKLKRAFAIGDDGFLWNKGKVSREELELGLKILTAPRQRRKNQLQIFEADDYPTELHVMYLAGRWGLDPTKLDAAQCQPGTGSIGYAPVHWAPLRLKRSA